MNITEMTNNNEFHTSEPRDEEINEEKEIQLFSCKRKSLKKIRLSGIRTLDLGDTGGALQPIELTSQLEAGHYTGA